ENIIGSYGAHRTRYTDNLLRTMRLLQAAGIRDPLCYELHIPMVVNRRAYTEMLRLIPDGMSLHDFSKRTLYGNLADIRGHGPVKDVKLLGRDARLPRGTFASTSIASWKGRVG